MKMVTKFIFWIGFNDDYLNSVKQLGSGFFSGIASKTIVYPLDTVKKRLQLQDFVHSREGFGKVSINNSLFYFTIIKPI